MRAFIINVHGLIGQSGSGDQQCQVEQPNVQDDLYGEDVGLCNQLIPRNNLVKLQRDRESPHIGSDLCTNLYPGH